MDLGRSCIYFSSDGVCRQTMPGRCLTLLFLKPLEKYVGLMPKLVLLLLFSQTYCVVGFFVRLFCLFIMIILFYNLPTVSSCKFFTTLSKFAGFLFVTT